MYNATPTSAHHYVSTSSSKRPYPLTHSKSSVQTPLCRTHTESRVMTNTTSSQSPNHRAPTTKFLQVFIGDDDVRGRWRDTVTDMMAEPWSALKYSKKLVFIQFSLSADVFCDDIDSLDSSDEQDSRFAWSNLGGVTIIGRTVTVGVWADGGVPRASRADSSRPTAS
jgi:hypothetical protein